ncbi:MAG: phosphonate ABC transporter, permease protein PhnE [Gemmatimonadaceae bacterium]|nr:phosphonate ABC transporter, permease protein PhnE [Gemmatimonadaceae bacterium]
MKARDLPLRRRFITGLLVVLVAAVYVAGYRETQIDPVKLFTSLPKSRTILSDLIHPDLFTRASRTATLDLAFPVPCGSAAAAAAPSSGPRLAPSVACGNPGDLVTVNGAGLQPDADVKLEWVLPNGNGLFSTLARTDARGTFTAQVDVRPANVTQNGVPSRLRAETSVAVGALVPSQSLKDVVNNIMVTVFMALLATTAGTIIAGPISFLAARNITRHGRVGTATYTGVRAFLNVTRSYDSLVLATVFALWVGFGAFAGVLALTVVTVASLGKMFSEAVEGIDAGPLEAVSAAGATRAEVVRYAVIPQIVPDFVSFIIYHWDINVRISTILGFVGGGGIGYYLSQRINVLEYQKAGTAIWAIVLVVWAMDFLSSEVRKRFT